MFVRFVCALFNEKKKKKNNENSSQTKTFP